MKVATKEKPSRLQDLSVIIGKLQTLSTYTGRIQSCANLGKKTDCYPLLLNATFIVIRKLQTAP
jgi:hypothetical protein